MFRSMLYVRYGSGWSLSVTAFAALPIEAKQLDSSNWIASARDNRWPSVTESRIFLIALSVTVHQLKSVLNIGMQHQNYGWMEQGQFPWRIRGKAASLVVHRIQDCSGDYR